MDKILKVKNLTKNYKDGADSVNILENLNIDMPENQFLCVLGPSGCGKTTLIRCIAGFEDYDGVVEVSGKETKGPGIDRIMVFQNFDQLFPWKTVEDNIKYPLKINGTKDKEELSKLAKEYLELVGLAGSEKKYPHQLSGGMKQRVSIARGLAVKPKIILMDEPFASLDAITRRNLQRELLKIKEKENVTVVFITHNIQEAMTLGDRLIVLSKSGEIKLDIHNTLQAPINPATEGYGELWKKLSDNLEGNSDLY